MHVASRYLFLPKSDKFYLFGLSSKATKSTAMPSVYCTISHLIWAANILDVGPLVDDQSLEPVQEPGEVLEPDQPDGHVTRDNVKVASEK